MSNNRSFEDEDEDPLEDDRAVDENDRADYEEDEESEQGVAPAAEAPAWTPRPREPQPRRVTRGDERAREVRETGSDRSDPCVMIGPSGSGKTTLLLAIGRACSLPADDALKLEFVPEENTAGIMKAAIDSITKKGQGPRGTLGAPGQYPFWIHLTDKPKNFWEIPLDIDLYMVMSDAAGGFFFPGGDLTALDTSFRDQLAATAKNAASLIFCVDVTKPRADVLERELPVLLSLITKEMKVPVKVPWQQRFKDKLQRRQRPNVQMRKRRCLNVSRFLLLLTQVDKLCYKLDKPDWFAATIDPVEQARELLGVPLLNSIQSALRPGATFAAGICSAWGFHPVTGRPFADPTGKPVNLAAETGSEVLRRWTPFGIRDALYFIASGKCRGTVKEIPLDGLKISTNHEPLEFSYTNLDEQSGIES
jgi:energy-coupling factor transporter ATP-binding protein EcfA2